MTVEITTLTNGFRVVTEHMPGRASAALGVWVDAGSRHETAAENGIAHFLEHMAFKGTATRSALEIAEAIEDVGGQLNAYTSRERTAYYARVLSDDVPLAMELIADILRAPRFHDADIETERGVILQEIGQALDTPDDIIFDWLQEVSYPDQPIGRNILGAPERVRAFTRADLTGFTGRHYAPGRMILAAAGDVEHGAIVRLAERLYGDLAPAPAGPHDAAAFGGGERRVVKPLEQAHMALALAGPAFAEADYHAALILSVILGGGMSSRLFQEAREKRGLCYTIFAQYGAWSDSGLMTVYAGTGGDELAELVDLTADQIARVAGSVGAAELARARAQTRAGLLMGLESASARAERLAALLSTLGRVPSVEETVGRVDAVDAPALARVAGRLLAAPPALVLYGPVEAARPFEAVTERLAMSGSA
ncbi:MAG TPA: pitrilysin family protein [Thermohalobaculum sp.]|nr:pitrilysin family protein [Thermohalobaculum sp.]